MLLLLFTYWYTSYRKYWYFVEVSKIEDASFVFIKGKQGNIDLCRIKKRSPQVTHLARALNDNFKHLATEGVNLVS